MKNNIEIVKYYNRTDYILNGWRHRDDGPAIEYANGSKQYWYNWRRIDIISNKLIEIDANLSGIDVVKYLLNIQALSQ